MSRLGRTKMAAVRALSMATSTEATWVSSRAPQLEEFAVGVHDGDDHTMAGSEGVALGGGHDGVGALRVEDLAGADEGHLRLPSR